MARWLMITGAILLATGALLHFTPGLFGWFGKLPGDITIESGRGKVFIPVTSMIVISIVISVILNILIHLFRR